MKKSFVLLTILSSLFIYGCSTTTTSNNSDLDTNTTVPSIDTNPSSDKPVEDLNDIVNYDKQQLSILII